jgi:hypothetical protein
VPPDHWLPGDIIRCVTPGGGYAISGGKMYVVKSLSDSGVCVFIDDDNGHHQGPYARRFLWVCRPGVSSSTGRPRRYEGMKTEVL